MYMKAKVQRKTRMLQSADETCQFLIDTVKDKMPSKSEPTVGQPAAAIAAPKTEEIKPEEEATAADEKPVVAAPTEVAPKLFWKFAVKAAYLKSTMLAACMEYAKPKKLMFEFAEPILVKILKHFIPEIFTSESAREDGVPSSIVEKVLPDHYYSFAHRRIYAKLRRMNYFVGEAEKLYRQLLHDELKHYDLYDFGKFEEENPVVSEVPDDSAPAPATKPEGEENKMAVNLIEEAPKDEAPKTPEQITQSIAEMKKNALEAEKKAA